MESKNHKNLLFFISLPRDCNGRIKTVYSIVLLIVRSAAGARVCEREVQRAEVMGTVGVDTWYMLIHSEVECVIVSS